MRLSIIMHWSKVGLINQKEHEKLKNQRPKKITVNLMSDYYSEC